MAEKLNEREGSFFLDMDDRRRLAVSQILMTAQENGGMVDSISFGQIILNNVVDKNEIPKFSDDVHMRLARILAGGGF